jgi:hypothetical protein
VQGLDAGDDAPGRPEGFEPHKAMAAPLSGVRRTGGLSRPMIAADSAFVAGIMRACGRPYPSVTK